MPAPDILTPTDRHHCRVYDLRSYRRPSPVSTRLLTDRHALVIARYGSPDDDVPPTPAAPAMRVAA